MKLFAPEAGSRPRVACELSPGAVVAARSNGPGNVLDSVAHVALPERTLTPGLKPGNIADRVAVIAAVRRTMEKIGLRPNSRGSDLTLIIPDGAARVLLLDFDSLPSKLSEALPIVRFRLKKLLPFEADDAMVTYQIMSSTRGLVRALVVAIPRDVLAEYETAVREAGFEPGSVLPSTLAALPGVPADRPALLVNGSRLGVTTAILRGDLLLLHRTVDLQTAPVAFPANLPPALFDDVIAPAETPMLQEEFSPASGFNAYADRRNAEEAVQGSGFSGLTRVFNDASQLSRSDLAEEYSELSADQPNSILVTPSSLRDIIASESDLAFLAASALNRTVGTPLASKSATHFEEAASGRALDEEIAEAVSVAIAYFEDTLSSLPTHVWSAGVMSAEALAGLLRRQGLLAGADIDVRELVESSALQDAATGSAVPRSALAGVAGALRI